MEKGRKMPPFGNRTDEKCRTDAKARYTAAKVGLVAARPRGRRAEVVADRGFCLLDEGGNCVAGEGYSMSAEEVIAFCERIP